MAFLLILTELFYLGQSDNCDIQFTLNKAPGVMKRGKINCDIVDLKRKEGVPKN